MRSENLEAAKHYENADPQNVEPHAMVFALEVETPRQGSFLLSKDTLTQPCLRPALEDLGAFAFLQRPASGPDFPEGALAEPDNAILISLGNCHKKLLSHGRRTRLLSKSERARSPTLRNHRPTAALHYCALGAF